MEHYIALLRGINVGGRRRMKMDRLRELLHGCGFGEVQTYIQSGNVVLQSEPISLELLSERISTAIEREFGYDVPVLALTAQELREALQQFPFTEEGSWKGYISFLPDLPAEDRARSLEEQASGADRFRVKGRRVYTLVDKERKAESRFSNGFLEAHFGMAATTRNLRTVGKLAEMS